MLASTPTLDLEPAVSWRLVPKARRQGPTVAGNIQNTLHRECATGDVIVPRSLQPRIRPSYGDAMEFALFAVTFAVAGWLHFELLALLW
jgi:hypothetical protein